MALDRFKQASAENKAFQGGTVRDPHSVVSHAERSPKIFPHTVSKATFLANHNPGQKHRYSAVSTITWLVRGWGLEERSSPTFIR